MMGRVSQSRIPIYTVYDRICDDVPAKNIVYTSNKYI
jgi:hypothetical protein